jgi:solute carrier family 45 protein 1/2/4
MTGGAFFPSGAGAEEYDLGGTAGHQVQWLGTPGVKGPRWAKMPLLTVGMLGIQVRLFSLYLPMKLD